MQTRLQAQGAGRLYQEACEMEDPRSYKVEDLLEKYDILPLHLLWNAIALIYFPGSVNVIAPLQAIAGRLASIPLVSPRVAC